MQPDLHDTAAKWAKMKYPFGGQLLPRDRAFIRFWAKHAKSQPNGVLSLEYLSEQPRDPACGGKNKTYDGGALIRLTKAGIIEPHGLGHLALVFTGKGRDHPDYDSENTYQLDARAEVHRRQRLALTASRPGQQTFSEDLRRIYHGKCAVTDCATAEALEAAHLKIDTCRDGDTARKDDNHPSNGILLRADIHALFDALLVTLTATGKGMEISSQLVDPTYEFLKQTSVWQPEVPYRPSQENIQHHRQRFRSAERSRKSSKS
jgi:hypothetical protein